MAAPPDTNGEVPKIDQKKLIALSTQLYELMPLIERIVEKLPNQLFTLLAPFLFKTDSDIKPEILEEIFSDNSELRELVAEYDQACNRGSEIVSAFRTSFEPLKTSEGHQTAVFFRTGIQLELADIPSKTEVESSSWMVTPTGAGISGIITKHMYSSAKDVSLVPGKYDVYLDLKNSRMNRELLLARKVEVKENLAAKVDIKSGIKLDLASWVPKRDPNYGWWGVAIAGQTQDRTNTWTTNYETMLLPSGSYDIYWVQGYDQQGRPLLIAKDVLLSIDEIITIGLDSGIRLDVAAWVPKRDPNYGWWGVTKSGEPADKRIHWTREYDTLVLPAGSYDVYWVQGYEQQSKPMLIAKESVVEKHKLLSLNAQSGIRVKSQSNKLDPNYGWWGVSNTGIGTGEMSDLINWSKGTLDQALLIPSGTYDVWYKKDYSHKPECPLQKIHVKENELIEVEFDLK